MTTEHEFHDPLSGQMVTLVIGDGRESTGVRHDCAALAQVFPELDCASCSSCHWQARVSGAWFMDVWEQARRDLPLVPPVCPRCQVGCLYEAGTPAVGSGIINERHYCPRCGWNPEVDDQ